MLWLVSGCGEVVSSSKYSIVNGQNLKWDNQVNIDSTNVFNYSASGQCIGETGTDVEIAVGQPALSTFIVPCVNNRFSTVMDLSSIGITPGMVVLRAEHLGFQIQASTEVFRIAPPPPPPAITGPMSGDTLFSPNQSITGTCISGATVYITGDITMGPETAICDLTGNFTVPVTFTASAGTKMISVYQEEFIGSPSPSVTANYDLVVPPMAPVITGPPNNFLTNSPSQTISGTCQPGAIVNVTSAVVGAPVSGTCSVGGTFTINVTLTPGDEAKIITVNQANGAGPSMNTTVTVDLDTTAPMAVTITGPLDGSLTNQISPTVTGTCEAGSTVSITGNVSMSPVNTTCSAGGLYTVPVNLTPGDGPKTITVVQSDPAGNPSLPEDSTFTLDATSPTVTISSTAPSLTTVPLITYQITFNEVITGFDTSDITVVNGSVSTFSGGPSVFNIEVIPTTFGPVSVSVAANRALDPAGNGNLVSNIFSVTFEAAMVMSVSETNYADIALVTQGAVTYNVDWGDGTQSLNRPSSTTTYSTKTYSMPFTGLVRVYNIQPEQILEVRHGSTAARWTYNLNVLTPNLTYYNMGSQQNRITGSIEALPTGLQVFIVGEGSNTTSGDIANLPAGLITYANYGNNTTSGNIASLPVGLTSYDNFGSNTTTGDIANLPVNMTNFRNAGSNTSFGDIASLPTTLTTYLNFGNNLTTGDIGDLQEGLVNYWNSGSNTTSGDIANLPSTLRQFRNNGSNTTTGDIATIQPALLTYENNGLNTTFGNISAIPNTLTSYSNGGSNLVTGDLADLHPNIIEYRSSGSAVIVGQVSDLDEGLVNFRLSNVGHTFTGDIADVPSTVQEFDVSGDNTLFGDISGLPGGLRTLNVTGNNTLTGDIATLAPTLTTLEVSGTNTITGNIANLPPGLVYFRLRGQNTTFGSINTLPASLRAYHNYGNNTTTATGTTFAPLDFWDFLLISDAPRSQTVIDNILISLSNVEDWIFFRVVDLRGLNSAAPGPAGLAAKAIIESRGADVFHN